MPFPPGGEDSWIAWSHDGSVEFEVVRRGSLIHHDAKEAVWRFTKRPDDPRSEVHVALCVDRPVAEVLDIAAKAGWPSRLCDRGDGLFSLIEVWVEGVFMIEVMDPQQTRQYQEAFTPAALEAFLAASPV